MHEGSSLGLYEGLEFGIEGREVGVLGDGVEGGVVSVVALILPDVNYTVLVAKSWIN